MSLMEVWVGGMRVKGKDWMPFFLRVQCSPPAGMTLLSKLDVSIIVSIHDAIHLRFYGAKYPNV